MLASRELDKQLNEIRKQISQQRKKAVRTLSPAQIRQGIRRGVISPEMELLIGKKADGSSFDVSDLKNFSKAREQAQKRFKTTRGVYIDQLIAASRADDVKRANGTYVPKTPNGWKGNLVRSAARLYKIRGNMLTFSVKASQESQKQFHQVRIRAEEWNRQLLNDRANPRTAVRNILAGKVSIDCDCERHQYWYRYLANIGGYAVTPPAEKDFPKIRNPKLEGSCCKHVLSVFQSIRTPINQQILSKHLEKQRTTQGFGDTKQSQMVTKADLKKIARQRPRQTDQDKATERAKQLEDAEKGLRKALRSKTNQKKLRQLKVRKQAAQLSQQERSMRDKAQQAIKAAAETFAKQTGISINEALKVMKNTIGNG